MCTDTYVMQIQSTCDFTRITYSRIMPWKEIFSDKIQFSWDWNAFYLPFKPNLISDSKAFSSTLFCSFYFNFVVRDDGNISIISIHIFPVFHRLQNGQPKCWWMPDITVKLEGPLISRVRAPWQHTLSKLNSMTEFRRISRLLAIFIIFLIEFYSETRKNYLQ